MSSEKTIESTKLIKLLRSFTDLEWKRFGRFVRSPYFNTNVHLVELYQYLKKVLPLYESKWLKQERVYEKIYGEEAFNLGKFQNLCSDLYELATDFVVDVHLKKERRMKKQLAIAAFSNRNYDLFKNASQQLIKTIHAQAHFLDSDDFLLLYQLYDGLHHHVEKDGYDVEQIYWQNALKNLQAFYTELDHRATAENRGKAHYLKISKESDASENGQLRALFHLAIQLHKSKDIEVYFRLKTNILDNWEKLKQKHQTDLLIHLINFLLTNSLIQKELGHEETLGLYKLGVQAQLFVINGKIRESDFFNIALLGFHSGADEWTEQFIANHQQYLIKEAKSFLVPLAYAYQANFKKDYKKVMDLLQPLKPTNQLRDAPKIKSLLVRAYFEAVIGGDEDYRTLLKYEIESFKKMMRRNTKLATTKTDAYLHFLKLLKDLLAIYDTSPNNLLPIQYFEKQLDETSPLILKKWLRQKLAQIKNATLQ